MKNRLLISTFIHLVMGIMFVFPMNVDEVCASEISRNVTGFYGQDTERNTVKEFKSRNTILLQNIFMIPTTIIRDADACSIFQLRSSRQIVDISHLNTIKSVVILC